MKRFAKAIAAVVGLAAVLVSSGQLDGRAEAIVSGVLALLTALGVYQVRNEPATTDGIHL